MSDPRSSRVPPFAPLALALAGCVAPRTPLLGADAIERARFAQARVERLRGLRASGKVAVRRVGRQELRTFLVDRLRREYPPGELQGEAKTLVALGLAPEGFDLEAAALDLLGEGTAGLYDPESKTLLVLDDLGGVLEEELTIAHEIAHALEDERHDLEALRSDPERRGDPLVAASALAEGSATEAMLDYAIAILARAYTDAAGSVLGTLAVGAIAGTEADFGGPMGTGGDEGARERIAALPRALRETLLFPYGKGLAFVHRLRREDGWARVDAAFADPPRSTEQILHPEKYADERDDPIEVRIAEGASPAGARALHEQALGELGVRLALEEFVGKSRARRAAAGWGGDAFRLFEIEGGGLAFLWHAEWDASRDAREFFEAALRATARRHGLREPRIRARAGEAQVLSLGDGRAACFRLDGERVLIAEGLPPAEAERAVAAMAEGDCVAIPARSRRRVARRAFSPLRLLADVRRLDDATEVSLLGGLLLSHRSSRYGWSSSLAGGVLGGVRSNGDRFRAAGPLGLLGYERLRLAETRSFWAFPLFETGADPDSSRTSLAAGLLAVERSPGLRAFRSPLFSLRVEKEVVARDDGTWREGDTLSREVILLGGLLRAGGSVGKPERAETRALPALGGSIFPFGVSRIEDPEVISVGWSLGGGLLFSYREERDGALGPGRRSFGFLGGTFGFEAAEADRSRRDAP